MRVFFFSVARSVTPSSLLLVPLNCRNWSPSTASVLIPSICNPTREAGVVVVYVVSLLDGLVFAVLPDFGRRTRVSLVSVVSVARRLRA